MKNLIILSVALATVACGKGQDPAAAQAANDPMIQKLESIPVDQRAEYVRTHPEEFGGGSPVQGGK